MKDEIKLWKSLQKPDATLKNIETQFKVKFSISGLDDGTLYIFGNSKGNNL
jgi:hypothetical protein